jgi:hypothetical protein
MGHSGQLRTQETVQLPNGTIKTFDVQNPFDKAHGDMCKIPIKPRPRPGILCLPEDVPKNIDDYSELVWRATPSQPYK